MAAVELELAEAALRGAVFSQSEEFYAARESADLPRPDSPPNSLFRGVSYTTSADVPTGWELYNDFK